jgi:hypothetical protein
MNIKFITSDSLVEQHFPVRPAAEVYPEWYKTVPKVDLLTDRIVNVKNCLPVFDAITSGYIIFNSYQIHLEEKLANFQNSLFVSTMKIPVNKDIQTFNHNQCPISKNPKDVFKIKTEWKITTPPGYSCIIQQPAYHYSDKYQLFPSIVDTDDFDDFIPISGYVLKKGPVYLEPGEPLIQVIPFKRESWNMTTEVSSVNSKTMHYLSNCYKKLFYKSKKFS